MTGPPPHDPTRLSSGLPEGDQAPSRGGRISRGFVLIRKSWVFLRERPQLLALPGMAAIASVLAMFAIEIPVLYAVRDEDLKLALVLAAAGAALPLTFISVFFNVGFLKMVEAHLDGDAPTVSYGLRAARSVARSYLEGSPSAGGAGPDYIATAADLRATGLSQPGVYREVNPSP